MRGKGPGASLRDTWRKNAPELLGLLNGALPQFVTARRPREPLPGVPVFCFHLVEPETFAADLEFLSRNGYHTIGCTELIEYLADERDLPPRSVMLTFDDGPRNFHDVAFPLLRHYAARATAFIAPGLHREEESDAALDARPMSWQEVRAIHAAGCVEFQSHTYESRFVPDWPAPAALSGCAPQLESARRGAPLALAEDLAASRRALLEKLPDAAVDQLAFPMYRGTPAAIETARAQGFRACYWGLIPGRPLNRRGDSPFQISRLGDEFVRRLPGAGRISIGELLRGRVRRARTARQWRRRFA
jgi:peptidoglycan/xylan/chitin deacetylase (PgdA/CDA1 family)